MNKLIISELSQNNKKLYFIINRIFSIKDLMGESKMKGIFCPFHGESADSGSKPSSRFYEEGDLIKLWCFQEHRSYYSYHYIKLILNKDPLKYLIKHSKEEEILYYLNQYKEEESEKNENIEIHSLKDLSNLYTTLDSKKDYSNWYKV